MGLRGIHPLLTERTLEEAEESEDATTAVVTAIREAMRDGVVTDTEQQHIRWLSKRALEEVRDAVQAAERANVADAVIDNIRRGGVTERVGRRARQVGITTHGLELAASGQTR